MIKFPRGSPYSVRNKGYTKIGGIQRAEMDFKLSFPDFIGISERNDIGKFKFGKIGNDHTVALRYSVTDREIQFIRGLCKHCEGKNVVGAINLEKLDAYGELLEDPFFIFYLE